MVECTGLSTGYPGATISERVDLTVREGEILSLIGPNGCGKTTLLKTLAGLLPPKAGAIRLMDRDLTGMPERELARLRSYLPQGREASDLTAAALVAHGRFPHLGFSRQMTARDRERVEWAMEITGVSGWRDKKLRQLSGGQCQRVYLAMTVAQDTPLLLWDEPATYLDVNSRLAVMELAQELNRAGKTVVMTLHDLADALTVSHRVCLMDEKGVVRMTAPPGEVFASGELDRVFSVRSEQVRLHSGGISYVFAPEERVQRSGEGMGLKNSNRL